MGGSGEYFKYFQLYREFKREYRLRAGDEINAKVLRRWLERRTGRKRSAIFRTIRIMIKLGLLKRVGRSRLVMLE